MVLNTTFRYRYPVIIEWLLAIGVIVSGIWAFFYLLTVGVLPPPFFHGANDTLMDLISTAYWAHNRGAYYEFQSIYPPLTFDILKLMTIPACYRFDGLYARDCDWLARVSLLSFFVLNIFLVAIIYRKRDPRTGLVRTAAMTLGLPMLFALERGNFVIVAFTFFVMGNSKLFKSARLRWFMMACAINLKPYLIMNLFPYIVRRKWRWFEGAAIMGLVVYIFSYAIEGSGTPFEIITNILGYSAQSNSVKFDSMFYASSYHEILVGLATNFPFMFFIGSEPIKWMEILFPILIHGGQFLVLCCLIGSMWKPNILSISRLGALSVAMVIDATDAGGYSQIFLLFLVFMEPWRGGWRIIAILSAYVLCICSDIPLFNVAKAMEVSWLSNRLVGYSLAINVGELARPGLLLLIEYALAAQSIWELLRGKPRSAGTRDVPGPGWASLSAVGA